MEKNYKKYLIQLIDAGISKTKISKECYISVGTIDNILAGYIPTERIQGNIVDGYNRIISKFTS